MFCKQCGAQIEHTAAACPKCGAAPETSNPAAGVADKMKAASKDSLHAFLKFATDPVAGLSGAYDSLGAARALSAGISFGAVVSLCILIGAYRLVPEGVRSPGAGGFFRLLVSSVVPFVTMALATALARLAFRGNGGLSNDSFIAGASLLPFGCVMLLAAIFGPENMGVISALAIFAFCLTVLMLFAGFTRITGMSERLATIAVPLVLMLSVWLTRIIYTSMINSYMGSSIYPQ
jgi:hypothetical protein